MTKLRMGDSWRWPEIIKRHLTPRTIVEIGCYQGEGAARLLAEFPDAHVYMVDPWRACDPSSEYAKTKDGCARLTQAEHDENFRLAMMATDFAKDRRGVCRKESLEAAELHGAELDVVIIDGDHSYQAVKADSEKWWQFLRDGGLLGWHDYNHKRFGVSVAANEFAELVGRELQSEGSCAWIVK